MWEELGIGEFSGAAEDGATETLTGFRPTLGKQGLGLHHPKLGQVTMSPGFVSLLVLSVVPSSSGTTVKI
jgi:hypothetical protein